jgi:ADP-ribose pyrophosphatase YjhB (NUDIX family)
MSEAVVRTGLYQFCPRCGAATIDHRSKKLIVCASCGLELYFNPCAAVAAIVLDAGNRVLLVRRAREPARGKLVFPGGFVDDDETAEAALRRELREETNLEVEAFTYLTSHPNTYPFAGVIYRTLDQFFVARVADFSAAQPLDGVDRIVTALQTEVRPDELAFESMRAAWRVFLGRA